MHRGKRLLPTGRMLDREGGVYKCVHGQQDRNKRILQVLYLPKASETGASVAVNNLHDAQLLPNWKKSSVMMTGSSTVASILHSIVTAHQLIAPVVKKVAWDPWLGYQNILNQATVHRGRKHAPYDIWCNHVSQFDNSLLTDVVPSSQGEYVTIVRDPAARFTFAISFWE